MILSCQGHTPDVERALFIAPNATIIGQVTLEEGCSVWYGAVIRADLGPITFGRNCNIQDNATLHLSHGTALTVGSGVTIGHGAVVHGCTIEDDVLIGMGAVVLNGAVVGRGSVIAAGAVVTEGSIIPPGSLVVGVPARVKGALSETHAQMPQKGAAEYMELAALHRDCRLVTE